VQRLQPHSGTAIAPGTAFSIIHNEDWTVELEPVLCHTYQFQVERCSKIAPAHHHDRLGWRVRDSRRGRF
jgi:hypothetical protein